MPTSNELVNNRPLSGSELREIMLKDVANVLDRDGMFSAHIGYQRVAYDITIKLHVDNPHYPEHTTQIASRRAARNEPCEELKAVETAPLRNPSPGPEAAIAALRRERVIESPNHARVEHNLPIEILVKDPNDGMMKAQNVMYDNKDIEPGPVKDTDISAQVEDEWEEK